jgi:hypothetical protein
VAGGLTLVNDWLGIVELHGISSDMQARNVELFERLGAWVATTAPGDLQRLFAEAGHRHAWHAELWSRRMPAIPIEPPMVANLGHVDDLAIEPDGTVRGAHYRIALTELEAGLEGIRARIDPTLDPATARTVEVVSRDVVDIRDRLDHIVSG